MSSLFVKLSFESFPYELRFMHCLSLSRQILGVVCQDGIVRFISTTSCKLLFDVGNQQQRVAHITISPNGRHIVCVMAEGNLHVYNARGLYEELNRVGRLV